FFTEPAFGIALVASAVTAVDVEIFVEKERVPGGVVIELEPLQVDPVHARNSHADKAGPHLSNIGVVMGNLPIPVPALRSALAPKDDEQRLAGLARHLRGLLQVPVPTQSRRLRRS